MQATPVKRRRCECRKQIDLPNSRTHTIIDRPPLNLARVLPIPNNAPQPATAPGALVEHSRRRLVIKFDRSCFDTWVGGKEKWSARFFLLSSSGSSGGGGLLSVLFFSFFLFIVRFRGEGRRRSSPCDSKIERQQGLLGVGFFVGEKEVVDVASARKGKTLGLTIAALLCGGSRWW